MHFFRATPCWRRVSVCYKPVLCQTTKHRITQTTTRGTPGLQFSVAKDIREIRPESTPTGASNASVVGKKRRLSTNSMAISRKRYEMDAHQSRIESRQLTLRVARSLGDSWASCIYLERLHQCRILNYLADRIQQTLLSSDQLRAASVIGRNAVTWTLALSTDRRFTTIYHLTFSRNVKMSDDRIR